MAEKRYFYTYEESDEGGKGATELAEKILNDAELPEVDSIVVGYWGECYDNSCQPVIDMMVNNKDKFAHVKSVFFGDMEYEECEVSWIIQGSYGKLFEALPNLEAFTVKGQSALDLGNSIVHNNLKKLEIICGGLSTDVLAQIAKAKLPALEELIIYIGQDGYGFDGGIEDIKPLTEKARFPRLKHLGLVNSEIQDEITELVLSSDILAQLEVLQLSYGTLSDKGGEMLLENAEKISHLKKIDLEFHYLSDQMMTNLKKRLSMELDLSDQQEPDEYNGEIEMYSMMGE